MAGLMDWLPSQEGEMCCLASPARSASIELTSCRPIAISLAQGAVRTLANTFKGTVLNSARRFLIGELN